ncbi:nitrogen assimilation transcription factor NirA [Aspergillus sclerotioniger CBS 115572]|uniref:Nitrogen assimilation transcription factor NirA n=1 Tax=Aspergillus sclerotioniger CBS 115572 TaxID=1450535 RepID=A0A317V2T6_9EURO|nr:nitrogen assimilation transcription factor NirA [Aspergillus sclerotioniger CBS 115572]PWY67102.1 nitrogen assimilation transcription factor NirA [Aspergillus sclerotioniger CBS 115572]
MIDNVSMSSTHPGRGTSRYPWLARSCHAGLTCHRPSRALINAAHRQRRAAENVIIALKNAEPNARDGILDSIQVKDGFLELPPALTGPSSTNIPAQPAQASDAYNGSTLSSTPNDLNDTTSEDEEYDPTTFLSRDECGTVGIFGPSSALHARSPVGLVDGANPRSAAEPDRYQLIAEAALQRQREPDLRHLVTIGGIPSELALHLLDLHWNRQHHTFLLTYRPAFMRDLVTGGPYCSEFLLSAVFACSSKFSERLEVREDPRRPESAGKQFFDRCDQLLAEQSLLTHSSIPTIAGLIMLGSTFNARGQTSKGWLYTGFALRMVYDMGLHLDCKEVAASAEDIEVRRRVFWAAFICDKLQSLYFGRPFTIQLRDAHVSRVFMDTFEENELWMPYVDPQKPESQIRSNVPTRIYSVTVFQQLCSLSKIMTSIIDRFYMAGATGSKTRKYLELIDRRLATWYRKLPVELQFEPWADDGRSPPAVVAPNVIILLTTYNALIILLHRPFMGSGHLRAEDPPADSWERCITAARNITSLALAYRSGYSLRRANYMLSYAVYVACTIHARNPAIRESTRRKEASSPLTVCLRCLDELAIPNCGVSAPSKIIRRLMEANGMSIQTGCDPTIQDPFQVDINLDFQTFPGLDFSPRRLDHDNQLSGFQDFNQDLDLLFGFMNEPDVSISSIFNSVVPY